MRRALDWLVVDAGGRAAGVVPFTGAGRVSRESASFPEIYVRVLHALQEQAAQQAGAEGESASGSDRG